MTEDELKAKLAAITQVTNEEEHTAALAVLDEYFDLLGGQEDHPLCAEVGRLADLIEPYEKIHYPIEDPCTVNEFSSRVCELGTKGCTTTHPPETIP